MHYLCIWDWVLIFWTGVNCVFTFFYFNLEHQFINNLFRKFSISPILFRRFSIKPFHFIRSFIESNHLIRLLIKRTIFRRFLSISWLLLIFTLITYDLFTKKTIIKNQHKIEAAIPRVDTEIVYLTIPPDTIKPIPDSLTYQIYSLLIQHNQQVLVKLDSIESLVHQDTSGKADSLEKIMNAGIEKNAKILASLEGSQNLLLDRLKNLQESLNHHSSPEYHISGLLVIGFLLFSLGGLFMMLGGSWYKKNKVATGIWGTGGLLLIFDAVFKNEFPLEFKIPEGVYDLIIIGLLLLLTSEICKNLKKEKYEEGKPDEKLIKASIKPLRFFGEIFLALASLITIYNHFSVPKPANPTIQCNCNCLVAQNPGISPIDTLGPFNEGDTSLDTTLINSTLAMARLKARLDTAQYSTLYIFGGVDKRPPKGKAEKKYGDNLSLSRGRAMVVVHYLNNLKDSCSNKYEWLKNATVIIIPAGATYFLGNSPDSLALDRYVTIMGVRKIEKNKHS